MSTERGKNGERHKNGRRTVISYLGRETEDIIRSRIIRLLVENIEGGTGSYAGGCKEQNRNICKREQG